jgi:anti-sigma regulatory factor (Ser/Thr protein kinase)
VQHPCWSHATTLPADGHSPSRSRAFVRVHLASHDLSVLCEDVELVASELATNAVRHARTAFVLTLESDGDSVVVSVLDRGVGARVEELVESGLSASDGRGLMIVDTLSADWGVDRRTASTHVWASFPLPQNGG